MDRPEIKSYKDLEVWQTAMSLAEACYRATANFPKSEMFGLTSQIRRAASSIPANIAEGHGRETSSMFVQFLRIAQGSLKELETHLLLSQRVGHLEQNALERLVALCESIGRMLRALIRSLQSK
ncbi:MAG: four helix bundle protein [Alphaproteobacteria bacterium]|nr:four helix bundle protein [Alphaproteobacteria bacterium]